MTQRSDQITQLLIAWRNGEPKALDDLMPLVHRELKRIARNFMRRQNAGHTLQTTALVNEAFVRLVDSKAIAWNDRAQFLAVSARVMRRVLVDHARARRYQKRGGDAVRVSFDEALRIASDLHPDYIALDAALEGLAKLDERKSRVVEMRFFGGLSVEETAAVLNVSPATVMGDWRFAKAWLKREMRGQEHDD